MNVRCPFFQEPSSNIVVDSLECFVSLKKNSLRCCFMVCFSEGHYVGVGTLGWGRSRVQ